MIKLPPRQYFPRDSHNKPEHVQRVSWYVAVRVSSLIWVGQLVGQTSGVPADKNYLLGPDDQIFVRVLQLPEASEKPVRIDFDGYISLPYVGRVRAARSTVEQFREDLIAKYSEIIREPEVTVSIEDFRSQPVSVFGAVNSPGVLQVRGGKSLLEILSLAGGLRQDSGTTVNVTRTKPRGEIPLKGAHSDESGAFSVASIDLKALVEARDPALNIPILGDDVVSVPRAEMIYVVGEVARSGGFVLTEKKSMSLLEALAMAGGMNRTAAPQAAKILRRPPGGDARVEMPLDLRRIFNGKDKDVELQSEDVLYIPGSAAKRASLRAIEAAIQMGTGLAIFR
jgi:polysaccharide export outer membrane protein